MLLCETAGSGRGDAEDLAIFASQLAALGLPARVDTGSVPKRPTLNLQFDIAPLLNDDRLAPDDQLVLLAADRLTDDALMRLRRLAPDGPATVRAFGCFGQTQTALGVRARLAYVLGREPEIFDLGGTRRPAPVFGVLRSEPPPVPRIPRLLLVGPDLREPIEVAALLALAPRRGVRVSMVTDSRSKRDWIAAHGHAIPTFAYGEALPLTLAERSDLAVFFGRTESSYRLRTLVANLTLAGAALLDGTAGHVLAAENDAFVPAPQGVLGLDGFLDAEVLPNLRRIGDNARMSRAAAAVRPDRVLAFLGAAPAPRRRPPVVLPAGSIVFMPTNGVGLGHAQRCALIARAMDASRPSPRFAAFASCTGLIKAQGFDVMPLIGRSRLHAQSHEHDLGNYLRLRALTAGARALVFDGGYIFDSVYRTVLQREVAGVWIRRGLWQQEQDNSIALDREKAFDRVIVPEEAFEELNTAYSHGAHVVHVGPIVQEITARARGPHRPARRRRRALRPALRAARRLAPGIRRGGGARHPGPGALRALRAAIRHAAPRGRLAERHAGARLVRLAPLAGGAHLPCRRPRRSGGRGGDRGGLQFLSRGALQPGRRGLHPADRDLHGRPARPRTRRQRAGARRAGRAARADDAGASRLPLSGRRGRGGSRPARPHRTAAAGNPQGRAADRGDGLWIPTQWTSILPRIGPHDADDIDALLAPFDPRRAVPGRDVFPLPEAVLMPQAELKAAEAVCVGLRAPAGDAADVVDRAMRLAAFAAERDVQIVVLSESDRSGFERFGFRVERIAGDTPEARAACEAQVRRFWNLDLVL